MNVMLVALYKYRNFPVRIMHSMLEGVEGVNVNSVFFKDGDANYFRPPTGKEESIFADFVGSVKPAVVGFSVLTPYLPLAERLTGIVRNVSPSSILVWGGIHPTILPESCIDKTDILCRGEGEGAVKELVERLKYGKPYDSIENLWINDGGKVIKNRMRPLIQDLDSVQAPSYGRKSFRFIEKNTISQKDPLLSDRFMWIQASRGCPYACSYCVNSLLRPLFKDLGSFVRKRSVGNILREIGDMLKLPGNNFDKVFFTDEGFGKDAAWLDEFEKRYKKEVGLPFFVEYNPKEINGEVLKKLTTAGLETLNFGIQTGSDYIRNEIFQRPGKNEEMVKLAKDVRSYGVRLIYDLILDNPYDTEESLKSAIQLLMELPRKLSVSIYSLQYFPSYPLTARAIADGHISPEEASIERLAKKVTRNFCFLPRLFPFNNKQILQNLIWLLSANHANHGVVRHAVFGNSLSSGICLHYLNIKSVLLSKLIGVGSFAWRKRNLLGKIYDDALSLAGMRQPRKRDVCEKA